MLKFVTTVRDMREKPQRSLESMKHKVIILCKSMEMRGIDPRTSRMLSGRSTI